MKVMVVGTGAREHALAEVLRGCSSVGSVVVAGGNAGMLRDGFLCLEVDMCDPEGICSVAVSEGVDLVVVGSEMPLALGVADRLRARVSRSLDREKQARNWKLLSPFVSNFSINITSLQLRTKPSRSCLRQETISRTLNALSPL